MDKDFKQFLVELKDLLEKHDIEIYHGYESIEIFKDYDNKLFVNSITPIGLGIELTNPKNFNED